MQKLNAALLLTAFAVATSAHAAPADVLSANKAAMGGAIWDDKATAHTEYAYAGQGMTGKISSLADLKNGYWVDSFVIGPANGANGFDGVHGWQKDPSGTITLQDGGDARQLAVNDGYRRANLWWRADRGGAEIVDDGQKQDGGASYDVLTVTPRDGKNFDAWFDAKTHLLVKVVELQGTQTITETFSDYATMDGVEVPRRILVNNGDAKYDQTETVTAAAFAPALPQSAYSAPKITVTDFSIAGGAKDTTFPIHLYNNHIYADVSVDGKGPYQFIFDTGGVNVLTPAVAAELGLKSEGQMQGNGAGSGHMDVGMTKVSSLQLGNAVVKDQIFAVMGIDAMNKIEGVGMPGMVGFETFRRFVTRVDYGRGTLTLIRPDAFDPKDAGTPVPFTFYGNTISAPGSYNGIKGNFTIDTGSRSAIQLDGPFVAKYHLNKSDQAGTVTGWGIGGPSRSIVARGGTLELGSVPVRGAVVEYSTDTGGAMADASLAGNVGAAVLKRFVVTLDYEHQIMYLKPIAGPIPDLDTWDRAGLWFNQNDEGYTVVDVTKDAPADQAGFKAGDEITAVNGQPATSLKLYEVRQMLRDEAPGTVVTFAVKRGGETKDLAVTLRDLI